MKNDTLLKELTLMFMLIIILLGLEIVTTVKVAQNEAQIDDLKTEIIEVKQLTDKVEKVAEIEEKQANTYNCDVTAYCFCEECCGEWALNRPKDENGNDIVLGASGRELIPGYSIAVDPNLIPLGSKVFIAGKEYRADDTGGMIIGNRIDVYFSNHEEALQFDAGTYKVEVEE